MIYLANYLFKKKHKNTIPYPDRRLDKHLNGFD